MLFSKQLIIQKRRYSYSIAGGNFVDYLTIRIVGGRGGDGVAGFARTSRYPKGKPNGGNGGAGGNIVFVPDESVSSLAHIPKLLKGQRGGTGGGNMKQGSNGKDCIIKIPLGCNVQEITFLKAEDEVGDIEDIIADPLNSMTINAEDHELIDNDIEQDNVVEEDHFEEELLKEEDSKSSQNPRLTKFEQEGVLLNSISAFEFTSISDKPVLVAPGGKGGKGNYLYGNNNHDCEKGQAGGERRLEISLKTLADVGLVGLPNAGKSSFLAAVSNAHPKIAAYPFTTLNPHVGIIQFNSGEQVRIADIPGLINGAHNNRGLGHKFLKHVERSKMLAFVVDFAQARPWDDVKTLIDELEHYRPKMSSRFKLLIANKADLLNIPELASRVSYMQTWLRLRSIDAEVLPVSAKHGIAVTKVTLRLKDLMNESSGKPNICQ